MPFFNLIWSVYIIKINNFILQENQIFRFSSSSNFDFVNAYGDKFLSKPLLPRLADVGIN